LAPANVGRQAISPDSRLYLQQLRLARQVFAVFFSIGLLVFFFRHALFEIPDRFTEAAADLRQLARTEAVTGGTSLFRRVARPDRRLAL